MPLFLISLVALFWSGVILVRTLIWMGRYLRISEYVLAFVLVSFATTLPELFIGVTSALTGAPQLAFGTIVGSSVLDIALVLGVVVLIGKNGLSMNHVVTRQDIHLAFGMIVLPVLLLLDGTISRMDGVVLLFFFVGYVYYLGSRGRVTRVLSHDDLKELRFAKFLRKLGVFVIACLLLLASSWIVVFFGKEVSLALGLPLFFVGVLIGFGTTLPELSFGVISVLMHRTRMSLGNIFGSILIKFSFVLGVIAILHPIVVESRSSALLGLLAAGGLIVVSQYIGYVNGRLPRKYGAFLLVAAAAFVLAEGFL